MKIVTKTADLCDVENNEIRCLLQKRFLQQCGATFFIVEPGDSIEDLEAKTGCPIVTSWFDDARYGDEDFCRVSGGCVPMRSWGLFKAEATVAEIINKKTQPETQR